MREYTQSMLLTDVDGDGFANEVMIGRSFCFPKRSKDETKFPEFIKDFCATRPVGTIAIYKFNSDTNKVEEISSKYSNYLSNN